MSENKKNTKTRIDIIIVVIVAVIIVAVSAIVLINNYLDKSEEEKLSSRYADIIDKKIKSDSEKADDIRKSADMSYVGIYINASSSGDMASIELCDDMTVKASGQSQNGWWSSLKKGEVAYISIGFPDNDQPTIYQVYGSYLIDTRSLYVGKIDKDFSSDSDLISVDGKMTLKLKKDGKAEGIYNENSKSSESLPIVYSGLYSVNGDRLSVTLSGDTSEFLVYDYGMENTDKDSGIASIFYEKQDTRKD